MQTTRKLTPTQIRVLREAVNNGWVRPFPFVIPTVAVLALERRGYIEEAPEHEGQLFDIPYRPTEAGRTALAAIDG